MDIIEIEKILAEDPKNLEALGKLAALYKSNKDFDSALKTNLLILEINENNFWGLINAGYCYEQKEEYVDAFNFYVKAFEISPRDTRVLKSVIAMARKLKDDMKQIQYRQELLKLDPSDHRNKALLLQLTKNNHLKMDLSLEQTSSIKDSFYNAVALYKTKNYAACFDLLEKIEDLLESKKDLKKLEKMKIRCAFYLNKFELSIVLMRAYGYLLDQEIQTFYKEYAQCAIKVGKSFEAIRVYENTKKSVQSFEIYDALIKLYTITKEDDKCQRTLSELKEFLKNADISDNIYALKRVDEIKQKYNYDL